MLESNSEAVRNQRRINTERLPFEGDSALFLIHDLSSFLVAGRSRKPLQRPLIYIKRGSAFSFEFSFKFGESNGTR